MAASALEKAVNGRDGHYSFELQAAVGKCGPAVHPAHK